MADDVMTKMSVNPAKQAAPAEEAPEDATA
jgi:hypothetical protein